MKSPAREISKLSEDLTEAYAAVVDKGGTAPQDASLANLAAAIETVPGPEPPTPPVGDNPYGKVGYYPWTSTRDISGDMVEIGNVDEDKLDEFLDTYPSMDGMSEFMYQQDWESEDPESNYVWLWYWQEGELKIQPEDFASTTGIQATLEEGTDWAYIRIETMYEVDTEAELLYAEFSSEQNLRNAGWMQDDMGTGYVVKVGNTKVYNQAIKSYEFGSEVGSFPDYFLYGSHSLDTVDASNATITSIGALFLGDCYLFDSPLDLSHCTTIGYCFLQSCGYFNQPLDLSSCETIGYAFLSDCVSFDQPLDVSNVTNLGDSFLAGCQAFNSRLTLDSSMTTMPSSFLSGCSSFNQPIDTSRMTVISTGFLSGCTSFNQPLSLASLTKLGGFFLYECHSFNQDITVPATAVEMVDLYGDRWLRFMMDCRSMTSTVTWNSTVLPIKSDNGSLATTSSTSPVYQTGVRVVGDGATRAKSLWPNHGYSSGYYRKLL